MDSSRVAIVDLGSNTFHILICDLQRDSFSEVHRRRLFVALAEGGIEVIKSTAIARASDALQQMAADIATHNVKQVKIVGTAALRSATNATEIHKLVQFHFNQDIEVIAGKREAELIYKGIMLLPGATTGSHLIMDIGGGSTEFLIVQEGRLLWSHSFDIGVGVLHELFHKSEPMRPEEIVAMQDHLHNVLTPLREELTRHPVHSIIGASGSFEVLASMQGVPIAANQLITFEQGAFEAIEKAIIIADYETRTNMEGMPATRVKLIVVAFVLLRYVIDLAALKDISMSPYAIKEGLLSEMQATV